MFKKGEYIVIEVNQEAGGFNNNYCFKQREDYNTLRPELDNNGSRSNGWTAIRNDINPYLSGTSVYSWRIASIYEAREYKKLGKPYDTSIFIDETIDIIIDNLEKLEKKYE